MPGNKVMWAVIAFIVALLFLRGRDPGPNVGQLPKFQPVNGRLTAQVESMPLPRLTYPIDAPGSELSARQAAGLDPVVIAEGR